MAKVAYKCFVDNENEPDEWSDWKCYQIALQDNFPDIVKDLNIQKNIISTYFNFYLSGKVPKGMSVTDIIFATIAIMPESCNDEKFIFEEIHYSNNGALFFISSEHKLNVEINNIINKTNNIPMGNSVNIGPKQNNPCSINEDNIQNKTDSDMATNKSETKQKDCSPKTTQSHSEKETHSDKENHEADSAKHANSDSNIAKAKIIWLNKKYQESVTKNDSNRQYTPEDNAKFCSFVNCSLNKWGEKDSARICLKYYFGLTAFILMRTITMSYNKVTNAFEASTFRNMEFMIFNKCGFHTCHSVPDKKCLKKAFKALRSSDRNIQIMFAKIVVNSRMLHFKRMGSDYTDIFRVGLLLHTAHFKMDLIKMLQEVVCRCDYEILMSTLNVKELTESRDRIYNFIKKYMVIYDGNILHTCHWARIIERQQFQDLTCSSNFGLAVVITIFKEKLYPSSSDVWKAKWVKDADLTQLQSYKLLGAKLYNKYDQNFKFSLFSLMGLTFKDDN